MRQQPLRDAVPSTICLGKLSSSKTAFLTVSNADGPGASPLQSGRAKMPRHHCCCYSHEVGAASAPFNSPLAESARLMPVTASPMPAHPGAIAGLISCKPAAEWRGDVCQSSGTTNARLPQPALQPFRKPAVPSRPARRTEAARADVKLLQPRQRPACSGLRQFQFVRS